MDYKQELIKLLGLKTEDADDVISNAAKEFQDGMIAFKEGMETENETLRNSAATAIADKDALKTENEKLTNSNKTLSEELANNDLTVLGDVINNDNRDTVKQGLISNRKATLDMFKGVTKPKITREAPLHNSREQHNPDSLNQTEDEVLLQTSATAKKITNRAREIRQNTPGMSFQSAFMAAQGEIASSN